MIKRGSGGGGRRGVVGDSVGGKANKGGRKREGIKRGNGGGGRGWR